jgi:acetyl esterase/lipase
MSISAWRIGQALLITVVTLVAAGAAGAVEPKAFDVEVVRNVPYYTGPGADDVRHRLDLYLPKGHKDYPVVMFVHGGAWFQGDKNHLGIYNLLGRSFARHGIGMVSPNYRLSPEVRHPEHIKDVARAFAWVHKNIGKHGGRKGELFVAGHSAGGHLAALLSTDETYLKEHGLSLKDIRGAIPVSGVYEIPDDAVCAMAFGKDPARRRQASPLHHVHPGTPPFLILYGDRELPACDGPGAEAFCRALLGKQCSALCFECPQRNHVSILLNATSDTDPVFQTMLSFITTQVTMDRLGNAASAEGLMALQTGIARYAASCGTLR